jgi:O-antigen/teichoic acid export membrane protein
MWYGLVVVSGFVMPRLIDVFQGPVLLGVWDLGWSLQFYVSLLSLGIASAISCHAARHIARQDWAGLNESVSSSAVLLGACSVVAVVVAVVFSRMLGHMLGDADAKELAAGREAVLALCLAASVQLFESTFNGVITGAERFDTLNLIRGARDFVLLVAMSVALVLGAGIGSLAWMVLIAQVMCTAAKAIAARHICPQLRISPRSARREAMIRMLSFGGKTVVQVLARSGTYQLNAILVAVFLGPVSLAVYARQRALVMHLMRFVKQYAQVFLPTSSALAAQGDEPAQRELLLDSAKYAMYVTLPVSLVLMLFGGPLLEVWMGPDYRAPGVLALLAAAHAIAVPQQATLSIAMGLDRHGWPALVELLSFVLGAALAVLLLGVFGGGMLSAAVALSIPIVLSGGVFLPLYMCSRCGMSLSRYVRHVAAGPLIANLPFAATLAVSFLWLGGAVDLRLAVAAAVCGAVLGATYWHYVLPPAGRALAHRYLALACGRMFGPVRVVQAGSREVGS